ncbi:hypothetical protein D3C81_2059560 [compost metagenome]
MEYVDLDVFTEVGVVDQMFEPTPGRFQILEFGLVENGVHLFAELAVDLGDHAVYQQLVDWLLTVAALEHLGDEGGHATFSDSIAFLGGFQPGLRHDVGE